jgi:transporter family protein
LQLGEASKVAPLDKLSVPLTIILSFLILGEAVTWQGIVGGLLITAGVLVLLI